MRRYPTDALLQVLPRPSQRPAVRARPAVDLYVLPQEPWLHPHHGALSG